MDLRVLANCNHGQCHGSAGKRSILFNVVTYSGLLLQIQSFSDCSLTIIDLENRIGLCSMMNGIKISLPSQLGNSISFHITKFAHVFQLFNSKFYKACFQILNVWMF